MNQDTNKKGLLTELKILQWAIEHNISVSIPFGEKERYDMIWDIYNHLLRIQVKTPKIADELGETLTFNCYSVSNGKKHKYTKEEIDFFAIYYNEQVYLIPIEECSISKKIRLADSRDTAKYANKVNWAKDYLAEEVLQKLV